MQLCMHRYNICKTQSTPLASYIYHTHIASTQNPCKWKQKNKRVEKPFSLTTVHNPSFYPCSSSSAHSLSTIFPTRHVTYTGRLCQQNKTKTKTKSCCKDQHLVSVWTISNHQNYIFQTEGRRNSFFRKNHQQKLARPAHLFICQHQSFHKMTACH